MAFEMNLSGLQIFVTDEDETAGRLMGASGREVVERAIHSALDREGVPRFDRLVRVTKKRIVVELPAGYELVGNE